MADWYKFAAKQLLELAESDKELARSIAFAVKKIERRPASTGRYVKDTVYSYTDPDRRFRINYNFHPEAREIEIFNVKVFDKY